MNGEMKRGVLTADYADSADGKKTNEEGGRLMRALVDAVNAVDKAELSWLDRINSGLMIGIIARRLEMKENEGRVG